MPYLDDQFLTCAANGDVLGCEHFLGRGASVSAVDGDHQTALMLAAQAGSHSLVDVLIANKAYPAALDWDGMSALHYAAQFGHGEICLTLIAAGVSVNALTKLDVSPLMIAAGAGHAQVCEVLMESGADLTARNSLEQSPLCVAACQGQADACIAVLKRNVEVDAAVRPEDSQFGEERTALWWASMGGKVQTCHVLIAYGANPAACKASLTSVSKALLRTPLEAAVKSRRSDLVAHVLDSDGDPSTLKSRVKLLVASAARSKSPTEGILRAWLAQAFSAEALAEIDELSRSLPPPDQLRGQFAI